MAGYKYFGGIFFSFVFIFFIAETAHLEETRPPDECFESREIEGYTKVDKVEIGEGLTNIQCSDFTGAVLWYGDPYYGTEPMGEMPSEKEAGYIDRAEYLYAEAVMKPRIPLLKYFPCVNCHNGTFVKVPKDLNPRLIVMHKDIVPNSLHIEHGHGRMWCLDCHNPTNRNTLIDHRGKEISFNQPQLLCGKCHGQIFHDWRLGVHGKRVGSWEKGGKKRWWGCTECHNPHNVDKDPFKMLSPERAPTLPKGMKSAAHERHEEETRKQEKPH